MDGYTEALRLHHDRKSDELRNSKPRHYTQQTSTVHIAHPPSVRHLERQGQRGEDGQAAPPIPDTARAQDTAMLRRMCIGGGHRKRRQLVKHSTTVFFVQK